MCIRDRCRHLLPLIVADLKQQMSFRVQILLTPVSYTHLDVYKRQVQQAGASAAADYDKRAG